MHKAIHAVGRKLMLTESEWNPKVIFGRAIVALLPEKSLHRLKKAYYGYLLTHMPEEWEESDSVFVKSLVHPGDLVLDIGASIGNYTKFLSNVVGPSGRVCSFEPNPSIFDFLSHNIKKLKLDNVELFNSALSDKKGTAHIVIPRYRWGSECHYDATLESKRATADCRQIEISVSTLDSFLVDRADKVSFIKCDVNYHELPCLRGALQTIHQSKPAILIEILPDPDQAGTAAAEVFKLLMQNGYEGYWFDGSVLRKRKHGERSQNYFFLTSKHVSELPTEVLEERV